MTAQPLPLTAPSFTERVADRFRARAGQWIDADELSRVGGKYAWRTRVSELRTLYGWTIENRQRTVRDGGKAWRVSEYRRVG